MTENQNVSRRRFLQATGGVASALALTGYTGSDTSTQNAQQQGTPPTDNTYRLINSTMTTLDPIAATDTASGIVIQQLFDALMNYPNGEIEVKPLIAKDYNVSDDFKTYTFSLRQGVQYHNGNELKAADFVYSFERLAASPNSQRSYFILDSINVTHETDSKGNYKPGTLGVSAPDDYTFKMELEQPFHATLPMLAYTSFAAIPEGLVDDVPGYNGKISQSDFATKQPIGAGPFTFENWSTSTEAAVSKFENYYGTVPNVDGVHWQIIEDDNAIYNYVMNKNADSVNNLPTSQFDPNKVTINNTDDLGRGSGTYGPVRNGATMNYLTVATINTFYIGFNTASVDKAPRQAAAYAMNQKTMVDQVFKGRGEPAYHFTPPAIYPGGKQAYTQHAKQNYPYGYNQSQIQQAQKVMSDAGYGQNNKYKMTLTTYKSATWQQIAQILRDQLASAYIDVSIEQAPFSTLIKRGLNGNLEAYTLGWIMDWPAPDNFLQLLNPPQTDTSKPDAISYTNWSGTNASKDAVNQWKQIQNNPEPTDAAKQKRDQAYVKMEEDNWTDVVFLNVYHRTDDRMSYQWVDVPKYGGAGVSRQMFNTVSLSQRS